MTQNRLFQVFQEVYLSEFCAILKAVYAITLHVLLSIDCNHCQQFKPIPSNLL